MARRHRADKLPVGKRVLKVIAIVLVVIVALFGFGAVVNGFANVNRNNYAESFDAVKYDAQITPVKDADGYYTFTKDADFKVLQFTDVHIGGGAWSVGKDKKALNAVAAMISYEKPDLVVVTGDLAYPVPFQAGTFNNKAASKSFALMMEQLGVYWTISFGNHDTEAYSYFNREKLFEFYSSDRFPHCIITDMGGEDVAGVGNQVIKVKNSAGIVTHAVICIDSHAYTDDDPLGIKWGYDNIKQNQVDWYAAEINAINADNKVIDADAQNVKSTLYFHIPLLETRDCYKALLEKGVSVNKNPGQTENLPENITNFEGTFGENPEKLVVYSSELGDNLFEKILELQSTVAVFNGHDHLNNCITEYKGVKLVYGMSIDNLAYSKISKYGSQRGCTVIVADKNTGDVTVSLESYYQDKYEAKDDKGEVTFDPYY